MKLKTAAWISGGVALAALTGWYFFIRKPNKLTDTGRQELKAAIPMETAGVKAIDSGPSHGGDAAAAEDA